MHLMRCSQVILCLMIVVSMVTVDAGKCRKADREKDGKDRKCQKKRDKNSKQRVGRYKATSKKTEAAPSWRRGPPKTDTLIVREGSDTSMNCAIRGSPSPAFSWKRNGKPLALNSSRKYRQKRSRLWVKSLEISDTGTYTCVAVNKLGNLEFTYSLKVLENMPLKDIDVVDRPENQTAQIGDTVIFRCRSRDWPQPKVHWTRRTDHRNLMELLQHESNKSDVLVLHNVTKADSGFYTCFIGNDVIHKKLTARLTVIEEGEKLQFEPPCSLHIKRQVLVDHLHGCRTAEPVLLHYCMGTCGRSYYVPQMVTSDQTDSLTVSSLNQTCQCCVGIVDSLRIVELDCPLGKKKRGFYTVPGDCQCQSCNVRANPTPSPDTIKT